MRKLPNAEKAVVSKSKLIEYSLNPFHETGKHKALVFRKALGMTDEDADFLIEQILKAASDEPAMIYGETEFGLLFKLEFELTFGNRTATVRTGWIVKKSENFPRLTTCFIK